jgi:hypothetical protein
MNLARSLALKTAMAVGALALAGACSNDSNNGAPPATPTPPRTAEPSSTTKAIWSQITSYKTWSKFAENTSPMKSASHENMFVLAYHNTVVAQAITTKTLPLPDGAVIVKENMAMATDATPMALTVMAKQGTDWYWIKAMPDGKVFLDDKGNPMEGKGVAMCTMCHPTAKNDGVITHDFTK